MGEALDTSLLRGFSFACRPDCGLCCYTTPAVTGAERQKLLQIAPETEFRAGPAGTPVLAARPDGGACGLLDGTRCRLHAARPLTCREFPLTVHVLDRAQVSVVLSCPGVDLERAVRSRGRPDASAPPQGLDGELRATEQAVREADLDRWLARTRERLRRLERKGRREGWWEPPEEARRRCLGRLPTDLPGPPALDDLPDAAAPLETLPLYWDPREGVVAWRRGADGGIERLRLREAGGARGRLGLYPGPERAPVLSDEARGALEWYLRYWLGRDQLLGEALAAVRAGEATRLGEAMDAELRRVAAQTLLAAGLHRAEQGESPDRLGLDDLLFGIRATDMDRLDQPTIGVRL